MLISEDIETKVAANKMEQNIMIIMPIGLVGVIKFMSPEFADNFTSG
jgi:tight adherence protein B